MLYDQGGTCFETTIRRVKGVVPEDTCRTPNTSSVSTCGWTPEVLRVDRVDLERRRFTKDTKPNLPHLSPVPVL